MKILLNLTTEEVRQVYGGWSSPEYFCNVIIGAGVISSCVGVLVFIFGYSKELRDLRDCTYEECIHLPKQNNSSSESDSWQCGCYDYPQPSPPPQ